MSEKPMPPELETLQVTVEDKVAEIRLNRPDKANAMNIAMWDDLRSCFHWADEEPGVRVVVLSGNGKNFCSGMDLSVFGHLVDGFTDDTGRNSEKLRRVILKLQDDLTAIESCRKPVLAAIHGAAVGGAIDMITCCDMRYCTEDATFSIREIDIGMAADVGTLQRLPRLIGEGQTRELAYTGRDFDGAEAAALGLVNRAYGSRDEMNEAVRAI
ncbi:MAG: enoyl-CoA hydratase-related protein, partial [Xanthomonadales bacterium]|nr:enoyl-CoA hydratase-related protein [Xanthomonadales bacterium]